MSERERERFRYTGSVISHSRQREKTLGIQKIEQRHFIFKARSENMSHKVKTCHTQEISHSKHRGKNAYTQNTEERRKHGGKTFHI